MKNCDMRQLQQIRSKTLRIFLTTDSFLFSNLISWLLSLPHSQSLWSCTYQTILPSYQAQLCTYHVFQFVLHDYGQFNSTSHDFYYNFLGIFYAIVLWFHLNFIHLQFYPVFDFHFHEKEMLFVLAFDEIIQNTLKFPCVIKSNERENYGGNIYQWNAWNSISLPITEH